MDYGVEERRPRWSVLPALIALGTGFLLVLALTAGVISSFRRSPESPSGAGGDTSSRSADAPRPSFDYWRRVVPPTPPSEPDRAPRPEGPVELWPHDQLADITDPNVAQPGYVPLRFENAEPATGRPRLAIAGLDERYTLDLGKVPISNALQVDLGLVNVGDATLEIGRVYPSMSALAFKLADAVSAPSGMLEEPLAIKPSERFTLTLRLEPERLPAPGTRSIIVQVFSNDPTHELFDPNFPLSHETRLRVVFEARDWVDLRRPVAPGELPIAAGAPRLWIPELALSGRGGDVLDLGRVPADRPFTATMTIANLGEGPLELDADPAPRIVDRPAREVGQTRLSASDSTTLTLTLLPPEDAAPDFAVPVRRELRMTSNDPVAGEVVVAVRAVFGGGAEGTDADTSPDETAVPAATATASPRSPIDSGQDAKAPDVEGTETASLQSARPPARDPAATLPPVPMPGSEGYSPRIPGYPSPPNTGGLQPWELESEWSPDVLAGIADPNVTAPEFEVYRAESAQGLVGPRLGLMGLSELRTANIGWIPTNEPTTTELKLVSVGDEPLTIARIYSGCACVSVRIVGETEIDQAGWLEPALQLQPGERVPIVLEVDPVLLEERKTQAKFIQIFSNDDSKEQFDLKDPDSHESRFRLVFGVTSPVEPPAGALGGSGEDGLSQDDSAWKRPLDAGMDAPVLWLEWSDPLSNRATWPKRPPLDLLDRIDLLRVPSDGLFIRLLLLRNLGARPLEVERISSSVGALVVQPSQVVVPPQGAVALRVVADQRTVDHGGAEMQHILRFESNDPLRPVAEYYLRGSLTEGGATGRYGVGDLEYGGDRATAVEAAIASPATRLPIPVPLELVYPSERAPRLWLPDLEAGRPMVDAGVVHYGTSVTITIPVSNTGLQPLRLQPMPEAFDEEGVTLGDMDGWDVEPRWGEAASRPILTLPFGPIPPGEGGVIQVAIRDSSVPVDPNHDPNHDRNLDSDPDPNPAPVDDLIRPPAPSGVTSEARIYEIVLRTNDPLVPVLRLPLAWRVAPLATRFGPHPHLETAARR